MESINFQCELLIITLMQFLGVTDYYCEDRSPDPNVDFPTSGEILRGQIYIKGNIVE